MVNKFNLDVTLKEGQEDFTLFFKNLVVTLNRKSQERRRQANRMRKAVWAPPGRNRGGTFPVRYREI